MKKKIICIGIISILLLTGLTSIVSAPGNSPPSADKPSGKTKILLKKTVYYTCSATDPEGDEVWLKLFHGANLTTGQRETDWKGPFKSGEKVRILFTWLGTPPGKYYLTVKAKDDKGSSVDTSQHLLVEVVEFKSFNKNTIPLIYNILNRFFEKHTNFLPLLKQVLSL